MRRPSVRAAYVVVMFLLLAAQTASAGNITWDSVNGDISFTSLPGLTPTGVRGGFATAMVTGAAVPTSVLVNLTTLSVLSLDVPAGYSAVGVTALGPSTNGLFAVGSTGTPGMPGTEWVVWNAGTATVIPRCAACPAGVYGISVANTGSSAGIAGMPARTDGLTMTQLAPTGGYADAISDDGNVVWHSTVPGITVRVGTTDYHPTTGGPGSILYTASPSGRYGLFRDPSGLLTVVDRTTWATMTIPSQDDPTGISDLLVVTLNDANGNPFVWTPMWGLMSERDWYMAMMPRLATDSQFLSLSFGPLAGVGDAGGYQDLVSIGSLDRFQVSDSLVTRSTGTGTPEPGSSFLVALGLFAGAGIRRFFSAAKAR